MISPGTLNGMVDDEDPGPIVQRLIFGARLAELREATGMTVDQANTAMPGWYRGKLGKVENGDLNTTDTELDRLFELYKVSGPVADEIRKLGVEARRKLAPARVPDHSRRYVWLERAADEIREYYGASVPGNLQSEAYALAQMASSLVIAPADMPTIARDRVARGDRYKNDPGRKLHAVLNEEAVLRRIGGVDVLAGQIERLLELGALPNVTIQIVPLEAGAHAALEYTFTLLYIARARASIVYIESLATADYLARPQHAQTYNLAFESAQRTALSHEDMADYLRQTQNRL
ncbi:helix-turn-helix protein [Umezawaea tangerina]|uniref:Helix-turn-helix protein n=2 Tax=Umezawaea tangerina TaxID=84725 RepID=A0A2T0T4F8_9PSEU|nr:helix-turn-helix protein [Umezawaea tangerina]